MMLYKARILQKNNGFSGELMRGRVIECQLDGYATAGKAVYALNQKIKEYNRKYELSIPLVSVQNYAVTYETEELQDMPYGLSRYFVDKQGGVHLELDPKANTQEIVLTTEIFGHLAEMVRCTQEQRDAPT